MLSAFIAIIIALREVRRFLKVADLLVKTADILIRAVQRIFLIFIEALFQIIALWVAQPK